MDIIRLLDWVTEVDYRLQSELPEDITLWGEDWVAAHVQLVLGERIWDLHHNLKNGKVFIPDDQFAAQMLWAYPRGSAATVYDVQMKNALVNIAKDAKDEFWDMIDKYIDKVWGSKEGTNIVKVTDLIQENN